VLIPPVFILIFGTTILPNSIAQTQISCGIQIGGLIHTHSDQQQYCIGSADGIKNTVNNVITKEPKHDSCLERSSKPVSILLIWKS
jgi:hypothetical protein